VAAFTVVAAAEVLPPGKPGISTSAPLSIRRCRACSAGFFRGSDGLEALARQLALPARKRCRRASIRSASDETARYRAVDSQPDFAVPLSYLPASSSSIVSIEDPFQLVGFLDLDHAIGLR
jgi:hypothetical protein